MYNEKIEALISAALADGVLTEKEKQVLFKRAQAEGIDLDEFEMVLDARIVELEKAEKSAPKSNKYGDVRKCPVCGAMVPALAATCPECGYEFSGVDANLSSQKLAEMLLQEENIEKKKAIIETFPIPHTKSDLFEFLTALQPRMRDISDPLSKSYYKKYQECIVKARASFSTDKDIRPFIDSFGTEEKNLKKQILFSTVKQWCLGHKGWTIVILFFIFLVISSIPTCISNSKEQKKKQALIEESVKRIESAISTNDATNITEAVKASTDLYHPLDLLTQLVEAGHLDAALYFYNNKTTHCSTYDMKWSGNSAAFTRDACKLLYDALIDSERMDEAWQYHPLEYDDPNYAGNANSYFSYVSDVVNHYCKNGKKVAAKKFVKEHLVWFINNVDNGKWGKEYPEFQSAKVNRRLLRQINNY